MTPQEFDQWFKGVKERCDKATPEPCGFGYGYCGPYIDWQANDDGCDGREPVWFGGSLQDLADLPFIAHSRSDLPRAVAIIEAGVRLAEQAEKVCDPALDSVIADFRRAQEGQHANG